MFKPSLLWLAAHLETIKVKSVADPNSEVIAELPVETVIRLYEREQNLRPKKRGRIKKLRTGRYGAVTTNGNFTTIYRLGPECVQCGRKATKVKILSERQRGKECRRFTFFTEDDRELTIDHIVPKSKGGETSRLSDNVQVMCYPCNFCKGNR